MNTLQKALKINAIFSSTSGIVLIVLNKQLADVFGTSNNMVFWIVGLMLIYFAATIWFEMKKQRKSAVLWIVIQDFLWVLGSVVLIVWNPFEITSTGNIIMGTIALIVLFMGINQYWSLNKS